MRTHIDHNALPWSAVQPVLRTASQDENHVDPMTTMYGSRIEHRCNCGMLTVREAMQSKLEPLYKQELREAFDVSFNSLLCLNNMPIKRYWEYLERRGELEEYMQLLVDSFNGQAGESLMCRDTVSVAWDGQLCVSHQSTISCTVLQFARACPHTTGALCT